MSLAVRERPSVGSGSAARILGERLQAFRSLGDNCEFGFVQRYGGVEPSGLLRFSFAPIEDVIRGLRCGFADFGAPGDLRIAVSDGGTYYCRSLAYNIWSNTGHPAGSIDPDVLLEREYGRLAHLKRRMLDHLADGSRILVRKLARGETVSDLDRLADAVREHGPSTILHVTEAGPDWRPEPARRVGDRRIEGTVRRFAPIEQAWDIDLEPWLHLVDSAYVLERGGAPTPVDAGAFPEALSLPGRLRLHAGRSRDTALASFARPVDPRDYSGDAIYAFSSWVWIPETFGGERVLAAAGHARLGGRDADLSKRGCWQRVWASGRLRREVEREPVGLCLVGTRRDRFWSVGARFSEGPIPGACEPPRIVPPAHTLRWLPTWRFRR